MKKKKKLKNCLNKLFATFLFFSGERGVGYKNSVFHRIVPGYIVQGGDYTTRDGNGQMSIYGEYFPDENFLIPHDSPGMLSMANEGTIFIFFSKKGAFQ